MDVDDLLERSLRLGPPDEERFDPAAIDLGPVYDTDRARVVERIPRTTVVRVRTARASTVPGAPLGIVARAMALGLAAVIIAFVGFAVGRSTTSSGVSAAPTPTAAPTPIIQEPVLPGRPGHAFADANQYVNGYVKTPRWVVCPADLRLPCGTVTPSKLDPGLADIYNNNVNPPVRGWPSAATLWSDVKAVTVSGDHLVVVADAHPVQAFDAHLFSLAAPPGGPTTLAGVSAEPGTWYLDLGTLAAGRYVLAILLDEGTTTPSFWAIGIEVTAPTFIPSP